MLKAFILRPALAVDFEVREVFLQTLSAPAPGSSPPAEALSDGHAARRIWPVLDTAPAVMVICSADGVPNTSR
jgi:hypothetical protein